jgi:hypothetical protein
MEIGVEWVPTWGDVVVVLVPHHCTTGLVVMSVARMLKHRGRDPSIRDFSFQEEVEPAVPGHNRPKTDVSVETVEAPTLASELVQRIEHLLLSGLHGLNLQVVNLVFVALHYVLPLLNLAYKLILRISCRSQSESPLSGVNDPNS